MQAVFRVALLALLALGCESAQRAGETAAFTLNPFAATGVRVVSSEAHGPFRFVVVSGSQLNQRFIVPDSQDCARVMAQDADVRFSKQGHFGRFSAADATCDAVGTLSLRSRGRPTPRRARDGGIPRSTARFAVLHRDEHYILLRGRFGLASRAGVPASHDIVAVVPDDEACREVASRGQASLEFRVAAQEQFRLIASGQSCFVRGFAMEAGALAAAADES